MRVGQELVEGEHEAVLGQYLQKRGLVIVEIGAMGGLDLARVFGVDQRLRSLGPRQQDAAFLEGLADGGDAETQRSGVEPLPVRIELRPLDDLLVVLVDTAAGKH